MKNWIFSASSVVGLLENMEKDGLQKDGIKKSGCLFSSAGNPEDYDKKQGNVEYGKDGCGEHSAHDTGAD